MNSDLLDFLGIESFVAIDVETTGLDKNKDVEKRGQKLKSKEQILNSKFEDYNRKEQVFEQEKKSL